MLTATCRAVRAPTYLQRRSAKDPPFPCLYVIQNKIIRFRSHFSIWRMDISEFRDQDNDFPTSSHDGREKFANLWPENVSE
jgi:hypothetical protein